MNAIWDKGYAFSLAYNFNGGHHLNRPINANAMRGDLMFSNLNAALRRRGKLPTDSPFTVSWLRSGTQAGLMCRRR